MPLSTTVDIRWPLVLPGRIPVHHQYYLLASLSRIVPEIHEISAVGVHPIRGTPLEPGVLELNRCSAVTLRAPAELLPKLLPIGGKKLDLGGRLLRLGVPRVFALSPAKCLVAQLVTIKGYTELPQFELAIRRQLDALGVRDAVHLEVGHRRIVRIRDHIIVGFCVLLDGLSGSESLRIQETGLGGRRHFSCGLFLPSLVRASA
jgi:CRISPR-associated protein Cas6